VVFQLIAFKIYKIATYGNTVYQNISQNTYREFRAPAEHLLLDDFFGEHLMCVCEVFFSNTFREHLFTDLLLLANTF